MISIKILNPIGSSASRSIAARRTANRPLIGSLAIASRRGKTTLAATVAAPEIVCRPAPPRPPASPSPTYRLATTRSRSRDRPTSARHTASSGGCCRSPSMTTTQSPRASRIPATTAPPRPPWRSSGSRCSSRTGIEARRDRSWTSSGVLSSLSSTNSTSMRRVPATSVMRWSRGPTFSASLRVGTTIVRSGRMERAASDASGPPSRARVVLASVVEHASSREASRGGSTGSAS